MIITLSNIILIIYMRCNICTNGICESRNIYNCKLISDLNHYSFSSNKNNIFPIYIYGNAPYSQDASELHISKCK